LFEIEEKFLDIPIVGVNLSGSSDASGGELQPTGVVTGCLSAPAQGDGASDRDGKKIIIHRCCVNGLVSIAPQSAQSTCDYIPYIFLALIQDKQTNSATVVSEQVFSNPSGNAQCAEPFINKSYESRYNVLDKTILKIPVPAVNGDVAAANVIQSGMQLPFNLEWIGSMMVNFKTGTTTADVANVTDNSIHLIGYTSSSTMLPAVYASVRTEFIG